MALATEASPDTPRTTKHGTPCAGTWNKKWVRRVQRHETELGRRICGARTAAGTPCLLPSNHPSGRCPRHGGYDNTGAPQGNRNAVTHGLYSRRIADCGIEGELELEEYLAVTAAVEQRTNPHGENPLGHHLAHNIALTSAMVKRAVKAALTAPITETVEHTGDKYRMTTTKVSAPFTACKLLLSELRQWTRDLERNYPLQPSRRDAGATKISTPREATPKNSGAGVQPAGLPDVNEATEIDDWNETPTAEFHDDDPADNDRDDDYDDVDYGENWQELKKDIADYEERWEKQERLLKNTDPPEHKPNKQDTDDTKNCS